MKLQRMSRSLAIIASLTASWMIEPRRIYLKTDDWIPNNPRLPVLIYRSAADFDLPDIGTALEAMFERDGWRSLSRGTIHRDFTTIRPSTR